MWRALGVDAAWPDEAHLTAAVFDAVQVGNWQRAGGRGGKPKPFPRPSTARNKPRHGIGDRARALLARRTERAQEREGMTDDG